MSLARRVDVPARLVDERARGLDLYRHVGQHVLDAPGRRRSVWPNCCRSSRVLERLVERALRDAQRLRGHARPGSVQRLHRHDEAHAFLGKQVLLWARGSPGRPAPRAGSPDAHLVLLLAEGEARRAFFDDERRESPRAPRLVGAGDDRVDVRLAAVGDPLLRAVEHVVAVAVRAGSARRPRRCRRWPR